MIERLLGRLAGALRRRRIPYMVIGGQAVLYYGSPRLTQDVDVTLGVDTDAYPAVNLLCREVGLKALVKRPKDFVQRTHVLPTSDLRSWLRVDFIFSNTSYERLAIRRSRQARVGHTTVRFVSLEDLIIHKLVAGRPIDVEDARVVMLKSRGRVDKSYVRHWLKQFEALEDVGTKPLAEFERLCQMNRGTL